MAKRSGASVLDDPIPSARLINWTNYVGVEAKPTRTVWTNLPLVSAATINIALTNAPTNSIIVLSNVEYVLSESIVIPDGKTLRGQGTNTVLREPTSGGAFSLVKMGQVQEVSRVNLDIYSGAWKASTNLSVVSALADLAVGHPFVVTATNDWNYVYPFGYEFDTNTTWAGDAPDTPVGQRQRGETVRLVSINNGTNLTFWPPLTQDYTNTPARISYVTGYLPVQYNGLENLAINGPTNAKAIYINGGFDGWISNVTFRIFADSQSAIAGDNFVYRYHVQHCTFNGFHAQASAINIRNDASGWLVENNIFTDIWQAIITASRGNNHAFIGNYSRNLSAGTGEYITHGAHKANLYWAHNVGIAHWADVTHGPSSHQTLFRNQFLGEDLGTAERYGSVHFCQFNFTNNVVGNVLGYPGMTGFSYEKSAPALPSDNALIWWNYNGAERTNDGGGRFAKTSAVVHDNVSYESGSAVTRTDSTRSTTLTNCYYYGTARPSWWGTNLAWPAIGPDVSGYTNMIPAQWRFLYGTNSF